MRRVELQVALVAALVCGASVLARIIILSTDVPTPLVVFGQSDVYETWRDAHLEGHVLPYFGTGFSYPPVIGYIAGLLSTIVATPRGYLYGWALVIVVAAGIVGLLLAREAGARRALLFWCCAPQLLLSAGINFDVLAVLFATGAIVLARRKRDSASLALAAVATATKLFSAAFAPLVVLRSVRSGRRPAVEAAATFSLVLSALYLPALLAPHSILGYTGDYAYGIGANIDSIWALPSTLLLSVGIDPNLPIVIVTLAGTAITYLVLVLPRGLRAPDPAVGFALGVVTILLWTRFYSPQYALWLLPFFAVLPVRLRTFALLTAADVAVFFAIFPLTLILHPADALTPLFLGLLAVGVVVRHVGLVVFWREVARLGTTP